MNSLDFLVLFVVVQIVVTVRGRGWNPSLYHYGVCWHSLQGTLSVHDACTRHMYLVVAPDHSKHDAPERTLCLKSGI